MPWNHKFFFEVFTFNAVPIGGIDIVVVGDVVSISDTVSCISIRVFFIVVFNTQPGDAVTQVLSLVYYEVVIRVSVPFFRVNESHIHAGHPCVVKGGQALVVTPVVEIVIGGVVAMIINAVVGFSSKKVLT